MQLSFWIGAPILYGWQSQHVSLPQARKSAFLHDLGLAALLILSFIPTFWMLLLLLLHVHLPVGGSWRRAACKKGPEA